MSFVVQSSRADPTIDVVVNDAASGVPIRMTVLAGVAAVGPESSGGIRVSVVSRQPTGESVGFYPPAAAGFAPNRGVRAQAEASLAQVVVDTAIKNVEIAYGIGDVEVVLAPSTDGTQLWPYLSFACYGDQPLVIRYRVTVFSPA